MQAELTAKLPKHLPYHVGHLGVLASIAAFDDGGAWLDALVAHLDRNRRRLGELLASELPEVGFVPPQAGYLAWLDCRALGLGDDPSAVFLERGRVALARARRSASRAAATRGSTCGTSRQLLAEAVRRRSARAAG